MGMSIDEQIKALEYLKKDGIFPVGIFTEEYVDGAIETMRKYQKIKKILNDWENSGEEDDPINILDNIIEVVEDGKID